MVGKLSPEDHVDDRREYEQENDARLGDVQQREGQGKIETGQRQSADDDAGESGNDRDIEQAAPGIGEDVDDLPKPSLIPGVNQPTMKQEPVANRPATSARFGMKNRNVINTASGTRKPAELRITGAI